MKGPSLAGRALMAVALMIGFYLLALGISAALVYIPYAEWRFAGRLHARLAFFSLGGAALILWSIVPRPDRFEPPGPRLAPDKQPRLFDLIRRVAHATGQALPVEVYAVPDMNAFVTLRGGVMGLGSRRVMGLGLPLLNRLTVAQFSGVLAHEFGHYHGGDTALGPWIYKTRAAIGRTLESLAKQESVLVLPFRWYGNLYVRITHAVSRAQEYAADALAAGIVGPAPLVEGLKVIHGAAAAFGPYWNQEYGPALQSGFRAPFRAGFQAFMSSPAVAQAVERTVATALAGEAADPYDTHPPLPDRIAALKERPQTADWGDGALAITLVDEPDALEAQLIEWIVGPANAAKLQPISWTEVPRLVWAPQWRAFAAKHRRRLEGVGPALPAELAEHPAALAVALKLAAAPDVATPDHIATAAQVFGAALATSLLATGWDVTGDPGQPTVFVKNGERIQPFDLWSDLSSGTLSRDDWRALCSRTGLDQVSLADGLEEGRA